MLERLFQKLSPPAAAMAPPGVAEPSSAPATAAVHIIADSGMVRLAEGQLQLDTDAGPERVRFGEIASDSLHGEGGITSPALRELMRLGIPVIWRARSGHYCGQSFDLAGALPQVRRAHYKAADHGNRRLDIAKAFVRAKLVNTRCRRVCALCDAGGLPSLAMTRGPNFAAIDAASTPGSPP